MRCEYREYDDHYYTVNVRSNGHGGINWDSGKNAALIIRCGYKQYPYDCIEHILENVDEHSLSTGAFNDINVEGVQYGIRLIDLLEKSKNQGCDGIESGYSYLVFASLEEDGKRLVFAPSTKSDPEYNKKLQRKDIQLEIEFPYSVDVTLQEGIAGIFSRFRKNDELIPTGYYKVDTRPARDVLQFLPYRDGDIYYLIDGIKIPITKKMLEQDFFIKAEPFPVFQSDNKAINVTCREVS